MREKFARIMATALTAQSHCDMPGEFARARAYVDGFKSGFLTGEKKNPADIRLLIYEGARLRQP
jgi:hypothetical protein